MAAKAGKLELVFASEDIQPPKPPLDLTSDQAAVWSDLVNGMPCDWLAPSTYPVAAQYCRHIVAARNIAKLITATEAADPFDVNEYEALLKMQEREGKAIAHLADKLRMPEA